MENFFSPPAAPQDPAQFWEGRTLWVRHLLNATWLLESARPILFLTSVVAMAAILLGRRSGWESWLLTTVAAVLVLAAVVLGFWRARPRFLSHGAARVQVESTLRLRSRLSAAAAGIGPWPTPAQWRPHLWRWHWRRLLVLPLCSAALVAAAFLLPLLPSTIPQPPPVVKPPTLEKIEDLLQALAQTPQLNQENVAALRQEAEELARQDPADWYSHASLEAADHLEGKMEEGLKNLSAQASKLQKLLGHNSTEAGSSWNEQLQGALSALEGSVPGLNSNLSQALSRLDASKFKTLRPEEMEELREALEHARQAGSGFGQKGQQPGDGDGEGEGDGTEEGEGMGNGGVDRGPGTGRLKLGPKPTRLGSKETEALENEDYRHAALGEALGTSSGQHEVDKEKEFRAVEGGAAATGDGAAALWRQQNVTPEERRRLQEFFK